MSKLRGAIKPVLEAGIAAGGTSLDDLAYLLPDGQAGDYLDRLRVYGREGQPCRRCGTRDRKGRRRRKVVLLLSPMPGVKLARMKSVS